jgi:hypothetical protein
VTPHRRDNRRSAIAMKRATSLACLAISREKTLDCVERVGWGRQGAKRGTRTTGIGEPHRPGQPCELRPDVEVGPQGPLVSRALPVAALHVP